MTKAVKARAQFQGFKIPTRKTVQSPIYLILHILIEKFSTFFTSETHIAVFTLIKLMIKLKPFFDRIVR